MRCRSAAVFRHCGPDKPQEGATMQVEHPICCGIDVHKDTLTACLRRVEGNGKVSKEVREFATTYQALLALADWLAEQHGPVVAMESTGVYTPPGILPIVGDVV